MNNKLARLLAVSLGGVVVFIAPFVQIRYGLDWMDTPFHLLFYTGQRPNYTILYFIAPWIGKCWAAWFGSSILSFRILNTILLLIMHLAPIMIVLYASASRYAKLILASFGICLAMNVTMNIFSYDSLSSLLYAGVFICGHVYLFSDKKYMVPLLGMLSGILIAVRFPNVLSIATVLVLIHAKAWSEGRPRSQPIRHSFEYLACVVLSYLALYGTYSFVQTGAVPAQLISDLIRNLGYEIAGRGNDLETHTLDAIVQNSMRDVWPTLRMAIPMLIIGLAWSFISSGKSRYGLWAAAFIGLICAIVLSDSRLVKFILLISAVSLAGRIIQAYTAHGKVISLLLLLIIFALLFKVSIWDSHFWRQYHLFVTSFGIILCIAYAFHGSAANAGSRMVFAFFGIMLAFNMPAGSNTGLWKASHVFTFTSPVFLHLIWQGPSSDLKRLLLPASVLLVSLSLLHKFLIGPTFMDVKVKNAVRHVEHPLLKGIGTSPMRKQNLEEFMYLRDSLALANPGKKTIFTGGNSMMHLYLSGEPERIPFMELCAYSRHKSEELGKVLSQDSTIAHVLLSYSYPEFPWWKMPQKSPLPPILQRLGFSVTREGVNYDLYSRTRFRPTGTGK